MNRATQEYSRYETNRICSVVVFFMLICANFCNAQYHPFPLNDAIWINKERTYVLDQNNIPTYTTTWIDKYCANGDDTTINLVTYKQIDFCSTQSSSYHGALRYTAGQVFFVPRDSLNEFILYDFTLNIGETVDVIFQNYSGSMPSYSMASTMINSIDTIVVNGTSRRRLYTDGYAWIEGIGCTTGLFMEPWINISNYFRDLICMSESDTTHYDYGGGPLATGSLGACDLALGVGELHHNKIDIEVFPNPTSGIVTIDIPQNVNVESVFLTNTLGQKLSNFSPNQANYLEMEIVGDAGVYFIEVYSSEGESSVVRIVKH